MDYDARHEIRRVRPEDRDLIEAMHARCSAATRRARWHGVSRSVPRAYLDEVCAGPPEHIAVAAWRGGELIGLASAREDGPAWAVGLLVVDHAQHTGVGAAMLDALVAEVRARGGHALSADVDASRRWLLAFLGRAGTAHVHYHRAAAELVVDLPDVLTPAA